MIFKVKGLKLISKQFLMTIFLLISFNSVMAESISIRPIVKSSVEECQVEKLKLIGNLNKPEKDYVFQHPLSQISLFKRMLAQNNAAVDYQEKMKNNIKQCTEFISLAKSYGGNINSVEILNSDNINEAMDLGWNPDTVESVFKIHPIGVNTLIENIQGFVFFNGDYECYERLLSAFKKINGVDNNGMTPLALISQIRANSEFKDNIIKMLVKHGAKTSWKFKSKTFRAIDYYNGNSQEVMQILM
ncbi:hypothetical protein ACFQ1T_12000 [Methylophilus glucosoxydans]|uniref:Ankyrin repeat protein n=1 Tax=Methylophilus glucosoxydans TaxID=752553 RepID=A0ABW3GJA9_9PROT